MDPALHILALCKDPFYLLASDRLYEESLSAAEAAPAEGSPKNSLSEECDLFCIRYLLQRRPLLIMEDEGNAILDISEVLQALNIPPNIRFVKGQMNLLSELATDAGLALMPGNSSIRMAIPGITSIKLPEDLPQVSLFALYRKDSENPLLPLFIEKLKEKLAT